MKVSKHLRKFGVILCASILVMSSVVVQIGKKENSIKEQMNRVTHGSSYQTSQSISDEETAERLAEKAEVIQAFVDDLLTLWENYKGQLAAVSEEAQMEGTGKVAKEETRELTEYPAQVVEIQQIEEEPLPEGILPEDITYYVKGIDELNQALIQAQMYLLDNVTYATSEISVKDLRNYLQAMPKDLENQVNYLNWYYYNDMNEKVTEISFDFTYKTWYEVSVAYQQPAYTKRITSTAQKVLAQAIKIVEEKQLQHLPTAYAKEKAIHDYLVANTAYAKIISSDVRHPIYSVEGALINRLAVCQGYAEAVKLFMDMLDIECLIVRGDGIKADGSTESHMWNMVKLDDGNWYHLDATWDDPIPDVQGRILYTYFNLDDEMIRKDHHIYAGQNLPVAQGIDYQYSVYEGSK